MGSPPPVAVTMGEPAGIGTEVTLKTYARLAAEPPGRAPVFFLIDDPARVEKVVRKVGVDIRLATIERPGDATRVFPSALPVMPIANAPTEALLHVTPGQPSGATARAVTASIEQAVALCLTGVAGGIVTAPIQKRTLREAGFEHAGHTEFLGALTKDAGMPKGTVRGPVMMLAAGGFRVVPVTIHEPLRAVPDLLTPSAIVRAGMVTAQALERDFQVERPRIAVAGLNPHAGEGGAMGEEEADVIAPAVATLREQGIDARGPLPADTMFHEEARSSYDAALAMYHDQGLVPIKTLAFHEAVNVTIGLPIVRTSPDHGTALEIAGRGVARPDSMIAAVLMAAAVAEARAA